ncbi:MAG TPA: hypothetical protein PLD88_03545, partial [Candidatus Berkiella sp.]|nr:hypothetical protein [Candidatus Berkiella sp.]
MPTNNSFYQNNKNAIKFSLLSAALSSSIVALGTTLALFPALAVISAATTITFIAVTLTNYLIELATHIKNVAAGLEQNIGNVNE